MWGPVRVEAMGLVWGAFGDSEPSMVRETPGMVRPGTHKTSRLMVLKKIRMKRQPPDPR